MNGHPALSCFVQTERVEESIPQQELGLEIFEDRWGGAEQHRVSGEHGRMAYVFGDQGFSQAVSADQHQIACLLQEVQGEGAFNDIAIDLGRPVPLEVGQGFKAFDGRQAQSPFRLRWERSWSSLRQSSSKSMWEDQRALLARARKSSRFCGRARKPICCS